MNEPNSFVREQYDRLYKSAELVSDRRGTSNRWLLSVNSALIGLYGYIAAGKESVSMSEAEVWRLAIPVAGILVSFAWAGILASYRQLNAAKFSVLKEIETKLEPQIFSAEEAYYLKSGRWPLSRIELVIPWSFAALYAALGVSSLL